MNYVSDTTNLANWIRGNPFSHKNQTFSVGIDYLHITRNYYVYLNDLACCNKTDLDEKFSTCIHGCCIC